MVWNFLLDPGKKSILPNRVWPAEVRHVCHDREFIRLCDCEILGMHHLRNAEILLSEVHGICDILETVVWVERGVVWNQTRLAVVDEGGEIDTVIPIGREIVDVFIGESGRHPSKEKFFGCLLLLLCL